MSTGVPSISRSPPHPDLPPMATAVRTFEIPHSRNGSLERTTVETRSRDSLSASPTA